MKLEHHKELFKDHDSYEKFVQIIKEAIEDGDLAKIVANGKIICRLVKCEQIETLIDDLEEAIREVPKSNIRPSTFGVSVGVRVTAKVAIEILQSWDKQVNNEDEAYDVLGCGRSCYAVKSTQNNKIICTLICEKEVYPPKFWLMRC